MPRPSEVPSFIARDRLYTLKGFRQHSGIAATRMREARLLGIVPRTIEVGRRKFIFGADAIAYIEQLSTLAGQTAPGNTTDRTAESLGRAGCAGRPAAALGC